MAHRDEDEQSNQTVGQTFGDQEKGESSPLKTNVYGKTAMDLLAKGGKHLSGPQTVQEKTHS